MLKKVAPFLLMAGFGAGLLPACKNDPAGSGAVADGKSFYIRITSVNELNGELTLVFDPIEFLTGEAAVAAAHKAGEAIPDVNAKGDTTWSVANDYYILNTDPELKTMPIAADANVQLLNFSGVAGKPENVASTPQALVRNEQLAFPFEVVAKDGKIVSMRAQFVP